MPTHQPSGQPAADARASSEGDEESTRRPRAGESATSASTPRLDDYLPPELEEVLANRLVKRGILSIVAIFGLIGTILGAFGYSSLLDMKAELRSQQEELTTGIAETNRLKDSLQVAVGVQKKMLEQNASLQATYTQALWQTAQRSGEVMGQYQNQMQTGLRNSENALAQVRQGIDTMSHVKTFVRDSVRDALAQVHDAMVGLVDSLDTVDHRLGALNERVISGGNYTLLGEGADLYGTPFRAMVDRIANNRVYGFKLIDRVADSLVFGPATLEIKVPHRVSYGNRHYELVLQFVDDRRLPILTGRDQAQLSVRQVIAPDAKLAGGTDHD